jgi:tetratricopeptide (TPR) repeat protein
MLVIAALVLAQVAPVALGAAAGSGGRPAECAPLAAPTAGNVWERAKYPILRRYCDLLASGAAKLASGSRPDEAREAIARADEASRVLPDRAAPAILRGRALVARGEFREAVTEMEGASARDPHALDDPAALFAWARALGRVGREADAEVAFRALLPRAGGLAPAERGKAEIEAALLAQARGAAGLDEAIALFRQARRDAQDALQAVAAMALSLALDRAGEREESRVSRAGEPGKQDPREPFKDLQTREVLADAAALPESDALVAFALGDRDPTAAREAWSRYLAGPAGKGAWAEHARAASRGQSAPLSRVADGPSATNGRKGGKER